MCISFRPLCILVVVNVCVPMVQAHTLHDNDDDGHRLVTYNREVKPPLVATDSPLAAGAVPAPAEIFALFSPFVRVHWDERFFYVESNGMPAHRLMVGITAWQQQVPLPQNYTGANAWRFPILPVVAAHPLSAKDHFFRGAIAVAANGVPIFNPIKNDGRTDTFLAGELDEYGGHAGRADDYHYHIAPLHLQSIVGLGKPIAYALDGYAIYGLMEPDGTPPRELDSFNGHTTSGLGYHYHATKAYPYLNGGFHGEVTERAGQVDPQPTARGVRPATTPLRGASITGFAAADHGYQLVYSLRGQKHRIDYSPASDGWKFEFVSPDGTTRTEHYAETRSSGKTKSAVVKANEPAPARQPWILVHAKEMDANRDGFLTADELASEVAKTFGAYDAKHDGRVSLTALAQATPVRSALGGFVKQHADEIDANHDGFITAAELTAVVQRMFDRAAANHDGRLPATMEPPARRRDA